MSLYLLINIIVVLVPLIFSFEKKIRFYSKFPFYLVSFVVVGGTYIMWDIIATRDGHWGFNPEYISGIHIFNLPLEEVLFFVTVPFASIFVYETVKVYLPSRTFYIKESVFNFAGLVLFVLAALFHAQSYTFIVLIFSGSFFVIAANIYPSLLLSSSYWIFITICYIPFFIVNYILTSLPIVTYNSKDIWGIRITTIPLEDFFYSFSMLSLYLLVYLISGDLWDKRKKLR